MNLIKWLFGKTKTEELIEKVEKLQEDIQILSTPIKTDKIVQKLILSNKDITAYLNDGQVVVGDNATMELYNKVLEATSKEEVINLLIPELAIREAKEIADKPIKDWHKKDVTPDQEDVLSKHKKFLIESEDFEEKNGHLYLVGFKVPLPDLMAYKFCELVQKIVDNMNLDLGDWDTYEQEYEALKNFWMWCILCPSTNSRDSLFHFLKNHDLRINKNGFFFAYRRVVTLEGQSCNANYVAYITSEYLRIRIINKKSAKHYVVIKDEEAEHGYRTIKGRKTKKYETLGTLDELFTNISSFQDDASFTDHYSKTFKIKIGEEVVQDRKKCNDDPDNACSRGLHVGNKMFGFNGFGDTHILVLINPMNAVSVPNYDTNKMRVCAYMPVAVITKQEQQTTFLNDADVLELGENYFADQVSSLKKRAQDVEFDGVIEEVLEIEKIFRPQMKEILKKRLVVV